MTSLILIEKIILVTTAGISFILSVYLFWLLCSVRKNDSQQLDYDGMHMIPASGSFWNIENAIRKNTYSHHKSLTEFIFRMSLFILILSFLTIIEITNLCFNFISTNCQWDIQLSNVSCWSLRFFTTFSIIASISWYFMMSVAILTSLTHRQTVIHDRGSFFKYQIFVIFVSFVISIFQILIAVSRKDFSFSNGYTFVPLALCEVIYLLCICLSMTYIRCCYPFYLTKNEKYRLIFLIFVFILLWIYPAIFDVLPNNIENISFLSFLRYLCQSSIGLVISIIWIFTSNFDKYNNNTYNNNNTNNKYMQFENNDNINRINNNSTNNSNNDLPSANISRSHHSQRSQRSHNSIIHKSSVNTTQHSPVANIHFNDDNDAMYSSNNSFIFNRMNLPFASGKTNKTTHTIFVDSTRNLPGIGNTNGNTNTNGDHKHKNDDNDDDDNIDKETFNTIYPSRGYAGYNNNSYRNLNSNSYDTFIIKDGIGASSTPTNENSNDNDNLSSFSRIFNPSIVNSTVYSNVNSINDNENIYHDEYMNEYDDENNHENRGNQGHGMISFSHSNDINNVGITAMSLGDKYKDQSLYHTLGRSGNDFDIQEQAASLHASLHDIPSGHSLGINNHQSGYGKSSSTDLFLSKKSGNNKNNNDTNNKNNIKNGNNNIAATTGNNNNNSSSNYDDSDYDDSWNKINASTIDGIRRDSISVSQSLGQPHWYHSP